MPVPAAHGYSSGPPTWGPSAGRPRVLIEHADPTTRERLENGLRARGYDTRACPGPRQRDGCPLLGQTICPAVAKADVVVTGLADHGPGRVVATTIGYHYPDRPLLIEGGPEVRRNLDPALHDHLVERLEVDDIIALASPQTDRDTATGREAAGRPQPVRRPDGRAQPGHDTGDTTHPLHQLPWEVAVRPGARGRRLRPRPAHGRHR